MSTSSRFVITLLSAVALGSFFLDYEPAAASSKISSRSESSPSPVPLVSPAEVLEYSATIASVSKQKTKMSQLSWSSSDLVAIATPRAKPGSRYEVAVKIRGRFDHKEWSLAWDESSRPTTDAKVLKGLKPGEFVRVVPIYGVNTSLMMTAVGPNGEIEGEEFNINLPDYFLAIAGQTARRPNQSKNSFRPSLGFSFLSVQQTGLQTFTETAISLKVSDLYWISERWNMGGNLFITALPLSSSQKGISATFLGTNFRFAFATPWLKDPWQFSLAGGGYYSTMFVTGQAFGYQNVFGPEIFPSLIRNLGLKDSVGAYFKYSPISEGTSLLTFDNRELAVGVSWSHTLKSGHSVSAAIDYADLFFQAKSTALDSSSWTFSGGYGL